MIDFGGGTLDLSLLNVDFKRDKGITISNKAISRYNDLGGQDVDLLIAEEYLLPIAVKTITNFDSLDINIIKNTILPQISVMAEDLNIAICNAMSLKAGSNSINNLNLTEIEVTRNNNVINVNNQEYNLGDLKITAEKFQEFFVKFFRGKNYKFK